MRNWSPWKPSPHPATFSLVDEFYQNSTEMLHHMAADPTILASVRTAIGSLQPAIRDIVDGNGQQVPSQSQVEAVNTLAQQLIQPAGVVLKSALEAELGRIGSLRELAGKTTTEARQKVVGTFVRIVRPQVVSGGDFEFRVIGDVTGPLRVESSDDLLTWTPLAAPATHLANLRMRAVFRIGTILGQQKKRAETIATWQGYVKEFPNGPQCSESQNAITDAEFQMGMDAPAEQNEALALQRFEEFLRAHPLDELRQQMEVNAPTPAATPAGGMGGVRSGGALRAGSPPALARWRRRWSPASPPTATGPASR